YRVYKPNGAARTFGRRWQIYTKADDQTLDAAINRTLEKIQWIQLISWKNDTDAAQQYQHSYSTGLKITEGSDVTNGFNLGASYEGMSIGISHSEHTLKSTETTTTETKTTTVNVHPRSELIFYQKRYDFRDEITFVNDAWGQERNIGPWGGYTPLTTKVTSVSIMAQEYFTKSARLPEGPGSVDVVTVAPAPLAGKTRKRENVTQTAKATLANMGLK
ncbi:hypothetical protein C8R45DRAFT_841356, partial [Mycena sanguinolenta]